jgi:peptide/nickel transport system substrate-binding protein
VWTYEGEPVEISVLIRIEDERLAIGDYVSNQLEDIGFQVFRDYKSAADASPIWYGGDPNEGGFHIYTGGWITTVIPRDLGDNFAFFYTDMGLPSPMWQNYVNDPEFYEVADRAEQCRLHILEERAE